MLTRYTRKQLTWVDVVSPTPAEVRQLMEEFDIHPLIADELLGPSSKQKAEARGRHLYLVMHVPTFKGGKVGPTQEIDFIVGNDVLITTRYEAVERLHAFAKEFERDSMLEHRATGPLGSHLFYRLVQWFYREIGGELEVMRATFERIEEHVFLGKEREMVFELSSTSRATLDFRRALLPHKELLMSLETAGGRLFGADFAFYARTLQGEHAKLFGELDELRHLLVELRETNDSLLSTKQNETMKTLMVVTLIFLPINFIAALFTIPAVHTPVLGVFGDFWVIATAMTLVVLLSFGYFRYKDLL